MQYTSGVRDYGKEEVMRGSGDREAHWSQIKTRSYDRVFVDESVFLSII